MQYSQIKYFEIRYAKKLHTNKYITDEAQNDLINQALGGVPNMLGANIETAPEYLHLLRGK